MPGDPKNVQLAATQGCEHPPTGRAGSQAAFARPPLWDTLVTPRRFGVIR